MEYDLRLMRADSSNPWGIFFRGGLDRPLIVDKVFPWSPAYRWLQEGDQVLEVEGHLATEINWYEAEELASLKQNYLRLGIRRFLPMFSNQYMGTRQAGRGFPRSTSSTNYNQGPYSRLNSYSGAQKPVNARPVEEENEDAEHVDYSFMQLPVRERRKMFLQAEPPHMQYSQVRSFTMPRHSSHSNRPTRGRSDTQSEYGGFGDDPFAVESMLTPSWQAGAKSAPHSVTPRRAKSSTGAIVLTARPQAGFNQPQEVSVQNWAQYASPRSPTGSIQPGSGRFYQIQPTSTRAAQFQPVGIRVTADPHPRGKSPNRVVMSENTIVYPMRAHSTMGTPASRPGAHLSPMRTGQPLRVNVYSSDPAVVARPTVTYMSPPGRQDRAWQPSSPVYPAYPANMDRSYIVSSPRVEPVERHRREQSVQPVTMYVQSSAAPTAYQRTQTQQVWRPLQAAPEWRPEPLRPKRQGRYISINRQFAGLQRSDDAESAVGVSDF